MCWIHVKENIGFPNYKLNVRIYIYIYMEENFGEKSGNIKVKDC